MHLVELIKNTAEHPHQPSLCIERLGPHSSDGPLLIFLGMHSIPQALNLHHGEDNVLVQVEAPLDVFKRGHTGVEWDHQVFNRRVCVVILQAEYT